MTVQQAISIVTGLCVIIFFALGLSAAESTKTSKPLTPERMEQMSRKIIALQNEQLAYQELVLKIAAQQKRMDEAQKALSADLEAARKESGAAPDCNLNAEKAWVCPAEKK
jgi:hypothetical protein